MDSGAHCYINLKNLIIRRYVYYENEKRIIYQTSIRTSLQRIKRRFNDNESSRHCLTAFTVR
jgi:hypothetical protein